MKGKSEGNDFINLEEAIPMGEFHKNSTWSQGTLSQKLTKESRISTLPETDQAEEGSTSGTISDEILAQEGLSSKF